MVPCVVSAVKSGAVSLILGTLFVSLAVAVVIGVSSVIFFAIFRKSRPTRLPQPKNADESKTHPLSPGGWEEFRLSPYPHAGIGQQQHMHPAANERTIC